MTQLVTKDFSKKLKPPAKHYPHAITSNHSFEKPDMQRKEPKQSVGKWPLTPGRLAQIENGKFTSGFFLGTSRANLY